MKGVYDQIFGSPPGAKEMIRLCQQELRSKCRELQRQVDRMEDEEELLSLEAKAAAKKGRERIAKSKLKQRNRRRAMIERFNNLEGNLQAISQEIGLLSAVSAMQDAMKTAVRAMYRLNMGVSVPAMQKIMKEFEKQKDLMEMKDTLIGEGLDDALGQYEDGMDDAVDKDYEEIMDQVAMEQEKKFAGMPPRHRQASATAVPRGEGPVNK